MGSSANNCPPAETAYAFVEGALSDSERSAFDAHLASCDACQALVRQAAELQKVSGILCTSRLNRRDVERIERCTQRAMNELGRTDDA